MRRIPEGQRRVFERGIGREMEESPSWMIFSTHLSVTCSLVLWNRVRMSLKGWVVFSSTR